MDAPQPPKITDEDLIAYLDGELEDSACRWIEKLLMTDPAIRRRLQELERTWELLEKLDEPVADDRLTRSTLEMVAVEAAREVQETAPLRGRGFWVRWLCTLGGLLAASALGFAGGWFWAVDPDRQLLEDLPLLENLDCYRQIDDFSFLKGLQERGFFQEDRADAG